MDQNIFLKRIKTLRTASGYSLYDVENLTGISRSTLQRMETGKTTLSLTHLVKLANLYHVPLAYLFGEESSSISQKKVDLINHLLGDSYEFVYEEEFDCYHLFDNDSEDEDEIIGTMSPDSLQSVYEQIENFTVFTIYSMRGISVRPKIKSEHL